MQLNKKNMKKLLLFLLLASSTIYGQQVVEKSDFKLNEGRYRVIDKPSFIKNGDNKLSEVSVTVGLSQEIFEKIGIEKINSMINLANDKCMSKVKNKYTYVSKIMKLSSLKTESQEINMTVEFTAQNDYGATKDGLFAVYFDANGNFVSISSIL